jgi:AcrR family transcriptional regulator
MINFKEDKTRDKIVEVADKLFGRFGFYKTSMDEIAKIARKAKGSLYYHFTSKEALFNEVLSKELEVLKQELNAIAENPELNSKQKVKLYLKRRMQILNESNIYRETIKADLYEHFEFTDKIRTDFEQWEKNYMKAFIEAGIEQGEFDIKIKEIGAILDVFIMVLKGLEIPFFAQGKFLTYEPYMDDMMNILIKGISK